MTHPVDIGDKRSPFLYVGVKEPYRYGDDDTSYLVGGAFLSGDKLVEDWGCGAGYARKFIYAPYRGIDGCQSVFADEQVSLSTYTSKTPRLFMRHVLEHNWDWRIILENLINSFTDRAVIILFIPPGDKDVNLSASDYSDASLWPGLQLCEKDLVEIMSSHQDVSVRYDDLKTNVAPYGWERIYFLEKK